MIYVARMAPPSNPPSSYQDQRRLLPLLPQLAVLFDVRNVSRAAARVGVTQPTMSRTLAAARRLAGDELLVRTPSGAALTPRGQGLLLYAQATLQDLERLWAKEEPMPAGARGTLKIAATDYVSQIYLPSIAASLLRQAPQLSLEIVPWSADALTRIERDDIQLGVNPLGRVARGFYHRKLAVDRYVVVSAAAPRRSAAARMDLERFVAAPHVLTTTEGDERGVVDTVLRRLGRQRNIVARVGEFQTAAALVAASDLVATLPERVARSVEDRFGLSLARPPLQLPAITIDLIWHERRHRDPLLRWARAQFRHPMET